MIAGNKDKLWLHSPTFDLWFLQLPGLIILLFFIPYFFLGMEYVYFMYFIHLLFFSFPHIFFMISSLHPHSNQTDMNYLPVILCLGLCFITCTLYVLTDSLQLKGTISSIIAYWGIWHVFMQHKGILKIYDLVQSKKFQDPSFVETGKFTLLFFAFVSNIGFVWGFTQPNIKYNLLPGMSFSLSSFPLPWNGFLFYLFLTFLSGVLFTYYVIFKRIKRNQVLPYPQILLVFFVSLCNGLPYYFTPRSAFALIFVTGTIFHNIQYFGFVWLYERYKIKTYQVKKGFFSYLLTLIHQGAWKRFFLSSMIFSSLVTYFIFAYMPVLGVGILLLVSFAHYLIDGFIWKQKHNKKMPAFLKSLTEEKISLLNPRS